jgi:hypothetical protein
VEVRITEDARTFAAQRGGVVFVSPHAHRCCHGSITLLDTTTAPGDDAGSFVPVGDDATDVRFLGDASRQPDQLVIELRGVLRRHLVAFWDGCAYRP